jgi:hypothetical protein
MMIDPTARTRAHAQTRALRERERARRYDRVVIISASVLCEIRISLFSVEIVTVFCRETRASNAVVVHRQSELFVVVVVPRAKSFFFFWVVFSLFFLRQKTTHPASSSRGA